jgi:hypothetical protein
MAVRREVDASRGWSDAAESRRPDHGNLEEHVKSYNVLSGGDDEGVERVTGFTFLFM